MIALALRGAALTGVGALLVMPDAGATVTLWGVLVTSVAGLIAQLMRASEDRKKEEQRHRFELEDRRAAEASRAEITRGIAENTTLTREASTKADQAYETANNVNEKIASLAKGALSLDRATAQPPADDIRRPPR